MQSDYQCPLCRSAISTDDVNVATDIALCRACGKTSSFELVTEAAAIHEALATPPKTVRTQQDFRDGTTIIYRKLSGALVFLIPFTALWSGLSMWGIYGTQIRKGEFNLSQSLFGLPFLAGTLVLLGTIIFLLAGKWTVSMRRGEGAVFVGVGSLGWRRRFIYNRETLVSLCTTNLRVNNVPLKGIRVRNGAKDFVFGSLIKENAKTYIAAAIQKEAQRL